MPAPSRTPVRTLADLATARSISVSDYGFLFEMSQPTVLKGVREGDIPATRVGHVIRIPASYVRAQLGIPEPEEWA
jgi:hypothetical protein